MTQQDKVIKTRMKYMLFCSLMAVFLKKGNLDSKGQIYFGERLEELEIEYQKALAECDYPIGCVTTRSSS